MTSSLQVSAGIFFGVLACAGCNRVSDSSSVAAVPQGGSAPGAFRSESGPMGAGAVYFAQGGNVCWIKSPQQAERMGVPLGNLPTRSWGNELFLGICPGAPGSYGKNGFESWEAFRAGDGAVSAEAVYLRRAGEGSYCHLESAEDLNARGFVPEEIAWGSARGLSFAGGCSREAAVALPRLGPVKSRIQVIPSPGLQSSQYSPAPFREPGNGGEHLFWCKNVYRDPQDRVWVAYKPNFDPLQPFVAMGEAIRGRVNEKDDLSCTPTVVKSPRTELLHMYYVTADRRFPLKLYMFHARNTSLVTPWSVQGTVKGLAAEFPGPGEMEAPSAFYVGETLYLYYALSGGVVRHASSDDGESFGPAQEVTGLPGALPFARVVYGNGFHFAVFTRNRNGDYFAPPEYVGVMASADGVRFHDIGASTLIEPSGSGAWDGGRIFHPGALVDGNELRIYYSGNAGGHEHWMQDAGIGLAVYPLIRP